MNVTVYVYAKHQLKRAFYSIYSLVFVSELSRKLLTRQKRVLKYWIVVLDHDNYSVLFSYNNVGL